MSTKKDNVNQPAQPAEFPDDVEIGMGADYSFDDPTRVENPDPSKRYFLAADDNDKSRPDGVHRVAQMGYTKSEKAHGCPDCVLMEIDRAKWERKQKTLAAIRDQNQEAVIAPPDGLEVLRNDHGVRKARR